MIRRQPAFPTMAAASQLLVRLSLFILIGWASTNQGIAFTSANQPLLVQPSVMAARGGSSSLQMATNTTDGTIYNAGEVIMGDPSENRGPLKVLFLSADTGGGHRASAESLAKQFLIHYPGSTYNLLDIWTEDGVLPYRRIVPAYKHLSAHPRQWKLLFHLSNSLPWEVAMDIHSTFMCERKIRRRIASYNPDVIVSVHPAMNYAPLISVKKISKALGRHIPFYTVVTDLGSAHCTWFQRNVDKLYVASDRLFKMARRRGRTPTENIVMSGLPIRHGFAIESENMGDRTTVEGKEYQKSVKANLGVDTEKPMILVMGGGEGVGSLECIVDELYTSLANRGVSASIYVVCGRNEKLQTRLAERDWEAVLAKPRKAKRRFHLFGRKRSKAIQNALDHANENKASVPGKIDVVGLGFVTQMADYMVAADVLVTKAGPGSIAEAAAVGLPVFLTSFLPGQEAGNVDFVLENGFGDFNEDPVLIAEEVTTWLQDPSLLKTMSLRAQETGRPHAASDIVLDIGSTTHTWMALNGDAQLAA